MQYLFLLSVFSNFEPVNLVLAYLNAMLNAVAF